MRNLRFVVMLVGIAAACTGLPSMAFGDDGALLDAGALFSGNGGAEETAPPAPSTAPAATAPAATAPAATAPAATPPGPSVPAAPAPTAAEEPKPMAGYDKGFFLQSKDGKFRLNFNARIQARYTYFAQDEYQGNEGRDESYFELERARIGFSGHLFDPTLKYKVEIDAETDASDKGVLTDAYVQYAPKEAYAFGVGQFKPAFIREEFNSSGRLQRVERSLANEFFNIDRNVGVWVEGLPSKALYYNFAVTNGIDTVNQASNGGSSTAFKFDQPPAFVGKLDFILSGEQKYSYEQADLKGLDTPLFVVGVSGLQQTYNGTNELDTFVTTEGIIYSYGVDAVFKYKGFSLTGDYVGRWYDQDGDGEGAIYAHGFNVQAGLFVIRGPDIELTARYSAVYGNEGDYDGDGHEIGPGINWYFSKSHSGKLQLDVAYVDLSSDLPSQTEELRRGNDHGFSSSAAGFASGEQGIITRVQVQLAF